MSCIRSTLISLILLTVAGAAANGEPIFPDELFDAYVHAGHRVSVGEDRRYVLAELRLAIQKCPQSRFSTLAERLASDLKVSIEDEKRRNLGRRKLSDVPAEFLADSRLPRYLITFPENWKSLLRYTVEHSDDPAVLLLRQGRESIDSLLPQLRNDSPTRAFDASVYSDVPKIPRVSDLALNIIEDLSRCKFHFNASSGEPFHELGESQRNKVIAQITRWWSENKSKSIAAGIRAQLPNGDFYAQITMAENLVRVAGIESPADRKFGLEVLREKARTADDYGAKAARVLEKYGDLSPVSWYCEQWAKAVSVRGRTWDFTSQALFYVAEHGGRKEWELLQQIAIKDIERANDPRSGGGHAHILGSLLNSPKAEASPFAIPLLGMALSHTRNSGSRYVNENVGSQSFCTADKAAEYLQLQTGQDFGYSREGTQEERTSAIDRAQKWWASEGKAKYTFDFIETHIQDR